MKRWSLCGLLLLMWPLCAWSQKAVRELPVVLQLDVNAQGNVTAVHAMDPPQNLFPRDDGRTVTVPSLQKKLPEALAKAAGQLASQWRFKVPTVQGKPAPGRTWAYAKLEAIEQADGSYAVHLSYNRNGPHFYRTMAPRFPRDVLRLHRGAIVIVQAVVQTDGSLADVHVAKVVTDAGRGASRAFGQAATRAVARWKAQAEQVDGRDVATHVDIPVAFMAGNGAASRAEQERLKERARREMQADGGRPDQGTPPPYMHAMVLDSPFVKLPQG